MSYTRPTIEREVELRADDRRFVWALTIAILAGIVWLYGAHGPDDWMRGDGKIPWLSVRSLLISTTLQMLVGVGGIYSGVRWLRRLPYEKTGSIRGRCPHCDYELAGHGEAKKIETVRCPECGADVALHQSPTPLRFFAALPGVLLVAAGGAVVIWVIWTFRWIFR